MLRGLQDAGMFHAWKGNSMAEKRRSREQLRSGQQVEESADIGVGDMGKDALPLRGGLVRMQGGCRPRW